VRSRLQFVLKVGGMVVFEHPAGPIDVQLQVRTWANVGCRDVSYGVFL